MYGDPIFLPTALIILYIELSSQWLPQVRHIVVRIYKDVHPQNFVHESCSGNGRKTGKAETVYPVIK